MSEALRSRDVILKADFKPLSEVTLANVRSWQFDPVVNEAFTVTYNYDISGAETDDLTNPKVEVLPTLDVNITARPVKPTVNY